MTSRQEPVHALKNKNEDWEFLAASMTLRLTKCILFFSICLQSLELGDRGLYPCHSHDAAASGTCEVIPGSQCMLTDRLSFVILV